MQFLNINKTKEYFYARQNRILAILSLSVLFLLIKEIPFLNIFFPESTAFGVAILSILILFKLYKNIIFLIFLTVFGFILYISDLVNQADQVAVLILICIILFLIEESIIIFKDEA